MVVQLAVPSAGQVVQQNQDTSRHNRGSDVGDSEYESADEEELGEEEEELILVQDSDGLGEDNKQLDDDEDRKNPQYIPKKGTFYEHDDRTAADLESSVDSEEIRTDAEVTAKKDLISGKKKVWKEDDKWSHDKFVDYEQSPKTREELITIYGYDIRNEEGPPRARRRRRYGRGPNKYTRNWEDLDAYSKPSRGSPTLRGGGRGVPKGNRRVPENTEEEFPTLGSHHQHISDGDNERIQNEKYVHKPERYPSHQYDQQSSGDQLEAQLHKDHPKNYTGEGRGRGRARGRGGPGGRGGQYKDSNRVNDGIGIGRGGSGSGQQYRPHQVSAREQLQEISAELKNITISTGNIQQQQQQQQARDEQQHHHHHQHHRGRGRGGGGRGSIPPRMQDASSANAGSNRGVPNSSGDGNSGEGNGGSSRPKRYSSQRQRSIPDQPGSPYQGQHQPYIDQGLDQGYGGFEGGNSNKSSNSSLAGQQPHLGSGSGGSFVPPAFTSGSNFPAEPFLGRPPAPRMFTPPSGPGPHMMPPGVAGSPVGVGGGPPRVVGPPPGVGGVGGPPGVAGPPVGVPTVGGPPVTGPPFLPAENMISYVGPPPPHPGPPHLGPHPATAQFAGPPPPQFPPFQGYPPGPTSQPQEIYSNGVTYYNTQNQHIVPRVNPPLQKRPKAAIPIVPPPDSSSSNSSSNNQETIETTGVQDGSNPLESQEQSTGEQIQEMSKEDDSSPVNQIKEEVNGVEHDKTQISSPSAEIIKIEIQESSNENKEGKENILYNEKTSLEEKIIDNTEVKKSETKEEVIEEKDVKKAVEFSEEKVNDDKKCTGESGEAAVLVDTPIAAS